MPNTGEHAALNDTQPICAQRMERIEARLESLEKAEWKADVEKLNAKLEAVGDKVTNLTVGFASLNGKIAGAIGVATAIGGAIGFLVQYWVKGG